jgi:hypothetical protein
VLTLFFACTGILIYIILTIISRNHRQVIEGSFLSGMRLNSCLG